MFRAHPEADPSAEIQRQLQALAPGVPVAWTPVECQADDGPKSTWQKIKVTDVNQDVMYVSSSGAESFTPMPCTLAVYQRQIEGQFVVIAWRLPTSIEKSIGPQNDAVSTVGRSNGWRRHAAVEGPFGSVHRPLSSCRAFSVNVAFRSAIVAFRS